MAHSDAQLYFQIVFSTKRRSVAAAIASLVRRTQAGDAECGQETEQMMRPQRCICVLLCAAALANCLTGCGAKTKAEAASEMQAKYDKIQVGMTAQEVDTILHDVESGPRGSGSYLKIVEDEHGHRISVLISNGKVELKVQHGLDD